jgi:alpha-tubulin suppressor-like RCC1 family protein
MYSIHCQRFLRGSCAQHPLIWCAHSSLTGLHVAAVSCGVNHTAALSDDGRLFTFGWGEHGRLGLGDEVGT